MEPLPKSKKLKYKEKEENNIKKVEKTNGFKEKEVISKPEIVNKPETVNKP